MKQMKYVLILAIVLLQSTMAWCADDYKTGTIIIDEKEVPIKFQVISEENKTCKLYGKTLRGKKTTCIDTVYAVGTLDIPSSLTYNGDSYTIVEIDHYAFYELVHLTGINIPSTVKVIGQEAFSSSGIVTVTGGENVEEIKDKAFYYDTSLTSVPTFSKVTSIGSYAFSSDKITSFTLPSSLVSIGRNAFSSCSSLSQIINNSNLESLPEELFKNCSSLESFEFNDSCISIGDNAFANSGLTSITIPSTVTKVGVTPFTDCSKLTTAKVEADLPGANGLFSGCTALSKVTLAMKTIPDNMFKGNSSLKDVTLNNVTTIGNDAFNGCSSFTSFKIPASVTYIGQSAFANCTGLVSFTIGEGSTLTAIPDYLLQGCTSLTTLSIPTTVTSVGQYAFDGCSSLASLEGIPGLKTVGNYAFQGTGFTSLSNLGSLETIGKGAFAGLTKLTTLDLPETMEAIGDEAFMGCTGLKTVDFKSVKSIGRSAFEDCVGLTSFTAPTSLKTIGQEAFHGCTNIESISLNDGLTTIGQEAFNSSKLTGTLVIPSTVTNIGLMAFAHSQYSYIDATKAVNFKPGAVFTSNDVNYEYNGELYQSPFAGIGNNTLIFLADGQTPQTFDTPNIVLSSSEGVKTCSDYQLSATKQLDIPYRFTAEKVTVNGLKAGTKTTVMLPFAIGNASEYGKFYQYDNSKDEAASVGFKGVGETTALTAYLVDPSVNSFTLNGATAISATAGYKAGAEAGLYGVTAGVTVPENAYVLSGDKFVKASAATTSPVLAYLVPSSTATADELAINFERLRVNLAGTKITIGEGGLSTFTSEDDVDFSSWEDAGVKAYVATGYDPATGKFIMQKVNSIKAEQGVLLKGTEDTQVTVQKSDNPIYTLNLMKGVVEDVKIQATDNGFTNFRLTNGDNGLTFYSLEGVSEVTIPAGKAYLQIPTDVANKATESSPAKGLSLEFVDGETTGITVINGEIQTNKSNVIYDLQGRRVSNPTKGLYIVNGKKVIIK